MKISRYLPCVIAGGLMFWGSLFFLEIFQIYPQARISSIAALSEFIVHFFTLFVLFQIYLKIPRETRKNWVGLILGCCCLLLMDISFELSVYFPEHYILSSNFITVFSGYLPYLIFLLAFTIFLIHILSGRTFPRLVLLKLLPFFVSFNLVVIFLFLSSIQYNFHYFSWQTVSHVVSMIMEFIIFDLALVGLIYSECRGFSMLLIGVITLITGDFFVNYSFLSQTSTILGIGELLWLLGLMGIFFSLLMLQKDGNFLLYQWCGERNRIKNKLALWSFGTSIISFLVFFTFAYFFSAIDKQTCLGLPLFVMGYSVIDVLASVFVGKVFSEPFKKLEDNVQALMLEHHDALHKDFSTEEFSSLNKFIVEAHYIREDRDKAHSHIGELAARVAHDIRSPLSSMTIMLQEVSQTIPEEKRKILEQSIQSVRDIANNLLNQYKEFENNKMPNLANVDDGNIARYVLLPSLIDIVLSQKRYEWQANPCDIEVTIQKESKTAWVYAMPNEIKCVLSNLLNNAYEALRKNRNIYINCTLQNKKLFLTITDTGEGIPQDKMKLVLHGSSFKKGNGLGLSSAKDMMHSLQGELTISSKEQKGTIVTLIFSVSNAPLWFPTQITLNSNQPILFLDDEPSMHQFWMSYARPIRLNHFSQATELLDWVVQNPDKKESMMVFSDQELGTEIMTGLELLGQLNIGARGYLITSHAEEGKIQQQCEKMGVYLIPKSVLSEIVVFKK